VAVQREVTLRYLKSLIFGKLPVARRQNRSYL
jgi:hypothetical protein